MKLREAFERQAVACAELGSPFMARLMTLCAGRLPGSGRVGERLIGWPGDIGPGGASLPLRLAGALHALVLAGDTRLAAAYPPQEVDDARLWAAVEATLEQRAEDILAWLASAPQTNEVRRAAALVAVSTWLAERFRLPFRVSELGASAGLNLMFDRFALRVGGTTLGSPGAVLTLAPRWTGAAPPRAPVVITERRGVDLNPVDPSTAEGRLRLRAYIWPDQSDRLALTDAAISVAAATVDRGDAIDWLAGRLRHVPGQLHLVYHTIAWQYFPAAAQERGARLLAEAGGRAAPDAPLARLGMEGDGETPGAGLWLDLWPGGERIPLGRIDYHGRWLDWRAPEAR